MKLLTMGRNKPSLYLPAKKKKTWHEPALLGWKYVLPAVDFYRTIVKAVFDGLMWYLARSLDEHFELLVDICILSGLNIWYSTTFFYCDNKFAFALMFYRYVFFLDPCNLDIIQRKIKSMALCVAQCPPEEMKTYDDIRRFAMINGKSTLLRSPLVI